jgi:hypothetical protein
MAHLFVLERSALAAGEGPGGRDPEPVRVINGRPVSSWGCRKCLYVLVGAAKGTRLEEFF